MRGFGTKRRKSYNGYGHRRLPPSALQRAWGGVTLVSVTALCAWTLCSTFADTGADQIEVAAARGDKLDVAVGRGDKLAVLEPSTQRPTPMFRCSTRAITWAFHRGHLQPALRFKSTVTYR